MLRQKGKSGKMRDIWHFPNPSFLRGWQKAGKAVTVCAGKSHSTFCFSPYRNLLWVLALPLSENIDALWRQDTVRVSRRRGNSIREEKGQLERRKWTKPMLDGGTVKLYPIPILPGTPLSLLWILEWSGLTMSYSPAFNWIINCDSWNSKIRIHNYAEWNGRAGFICGGHSLGQYVLIMQKLQVFLLKAPGAPHWLP